MVYFQYGSRGVNILDELIKNSVVDGIIWDPRYCNKNNILQKKKNITQSINYLFDPKFYYFEFEDCDKKNLTELTFYPTEKIDRRFLNNEAELNSFFAELIKYQQEIGTTKIVIPSLLIKKFDDVNSERQLNLIDKFILFIEKNDIDIEYMINLTIEEEAFSDSEKMKDFINNLEEFYSKTNNIYFTVIRPLESANKLLFKSELLENIIYFIYYLNYIGYKIIVGYTGLEGILFLAAGASGIGTNVTQSLKRLVLEKIGFGEQKENNGGGQPKSHYTSIPLLNYLKCELHIDNIREESKNLLYPLILSNTSLDEKIISGKKHTDYLLVETQYQYMECLKSLDKTIEQQQSVNDKINLVNRMINDAISNTTIYNGEFKIDNLSYSHLINWQEALTKFSEKNII